jgi:hypothetical protein
MPRQWTIPSGRLQHKKKSCPRFILTSEIESYVTIVVPDLFEHDCTYFFTLLFKLRVLKTLRKNTFIKETNSKLKFLDQCN